MSALDKLIEAVEAGVLKGTYDDLMSFDRLCDAAIPQDARGLSVHAFKAYEGSLDAALALHEALLPGWDYVIGRANGGLTEHAQLESETYFADTTARAWLLGTLSAYRSVQA